MCDIQFKSPYGAVCLSVCLYTNARSLCPKINSLVDCFGDMDLAVGVVTETWFSDGVELQEDIEHLSLGTGLRMLCKNRPKNDRGFSHGGVGLLFKELGGYPEGDKDAQS